MNERELEEFIFSLKKEERSLRVIREFLRVLDNPHNDFDAVHVGGSNGKGSVTEMIYRILSERYKVGKYISPHICRINERIVVSGREIETEYMLKFVTKYGEYAKKIGAHFFDLLTAMAFKYFSDAEVDWAVVEVGLGGRYDSTNIINSKISVITNVSYEHTDVLGTSIEDILYEKAGIIKNSRAILGPANVLTRRIFKNLVKNSILVDECFRILDVCMSEGSLEVEIDGILSGRFRINATGTYQIKNLLTALAAAKVLMDEEVVEFEDIQRGLEKAEFPGRFEIFKLKNGRLILDSAHNPAGARELVDTYLKLYGYGGKALVTQMKDKDHINFFRELCRAVDEIIIPKYDYWRAQTQEKLARCAMRFFKNVEVISEDAISYLREAEFDRNIIVTGSIYLVGDVRRWLMAEGR